MQSPRITLRQLQVFVSVARLGSTVGAGSDIGLSQSATSASLKELERALSLTLFERAGKGLRINESGRELLPLAHGVLDRAMEFQVAGRDAPAQVQSVRIGASLTIADRILPGLLAALLGDAPRTASTWRSQIVVGNTASVCERVAAFELDIGLVEGSVSMPELRVSRWLQDELVIVGDAATARRMARFSTPARLSRALGDEPWLLREPGSGTREAVDQALLPRIRAYRRAIEIASNDAIQGCVAGGIGVACLSRWSIAPLLASGRLVEIATPWTRIRRQCHWVVHRRKSFAAGLERLVGLLRDDRQPPME